VALKRALALNGVSGLCITKLDVLDKVDRIKICVAYRLNGAEIEAPPSGAATLARCTPVYEELAGWMSPTVGVRKLDDLPPEARRYLERVEALTQTPVHMISTGPERDDIIVLSHPFE
jgi:adenylosuccinate synthase